MKKKGQMKRNTRVRFLSVHSEGASAESWTSVPEPASEGSCLLLVSVCVCVCVCFRTSSWSVSDSSGRSTKTCRLAAVEPATLRQNRNVWMFSDTWRKVGFHRRCVNNQIMTFLSDNLTQKLCFSKSWERNFRGEENQTCGFSITSLIDEENENLNELQHGKNLQPWAIHVPSPDIVYEWYQK